jgi:D-alanyl-D-alanine carboxypeptidase
LGPSFARQEFFLHPGDTISLIQTAGDSPVPPDGWDLVSSRPEWFQVNPQGEVRLTEAALEGIRSGTLVSGEAAEVRARMGGVLAEGEGESCLVILRKDPRRTLDGEGRLRDPGDYDALVNKSRRLPSSYIPPDLVLVETPTCLEMEEVRKMRREASAALTELFRAAAGEGFTLVARSGYRAYRTQEALYNNYVFTQGQEYADRYSARPGTSEHQTGLVMDITSPEMNYQLEESFGETPAGMWVAANAHRFGFIIRYPRGKEGITGYAYEPWHLRYVKPALAGRLHSLGLTLEEFFNLP